MFGTARTAGSGPTGQRAAGSGRPEHTDITDTRTAVVLLAGQAMVTAAPGGAAVGVIGLPAA